MLYFKLKKALIYALLKQIVTLCAIIEKNKTFRELQVNTEVKKII